MMRLGRILVAVTVLGGSGAGAMAQTQTTQTRTVEVPAFAFDYRFEGEHTDDGLDKDAKADTPSTGLALKDLHLGLSGKVDARFDYEVYVNLIGEDGPRFDVGFVRWTAERKTWALLFGHQRIHTYGYEARHHGALTVIDSVGFENKPFEYAPAATVEYTAADVGVFTLQAVDDAAPKGGWNEGEGGKKQLAVMGELATTGFDLSDATLAPLLQAGVYDMGHSTIYGFGVLYKSKVVAASLDYIHDTFGAKGVETDSAGKTKAKKQNNIRTNTALNVDVEMDSISPFAHYSIYNVRDYTAAGAKEPKANASTAAFNDNGKTLGGGFHINTISKKLRPFLAFERKSGNFLNTSGKEEEMSVNMYKLGLGGRF